MVLLSPKLYTRIDVDYICSDDCDGTYSVRVRDIHHLRNSINDYPILSLHIPAARRVLHAASNGEVLFVPVYDLCVAYARHGCSFMAGDANVLKRHDILSLQMY
jgi:hypothetical protein